MDCCLGAVACETRHAHHGAVCRGFESCRSGVQTVWGIKIKHVTPLFSKLLLRVKPATQGHPGGPWGVRCHHARQLNSRTLTFFDEFASFWLEN